MQYVWACAHHSVWSDVSLLSCACAWADDGEYLFVFLACSDPLTRIIVDCRVRRKEDEKMCLMKWFEDETTRTEGGQDEGSRARATVSE